MTTNTTMNILQNILDNTRQEVAISKQKISLSQLREMQNYQRKCLSLYNALNKNIAVIAEIKKASPSKGIIRADFNPLEIAKEYVANGASAISVLTDKKYFQGDINYISKIRPYVPIPILRKDFIVDSYQLTEAKAYGADAVLLIVAALDKNHLIDLHDEANEIGLECLVEVHDEYELETLDLDKVKIIGINNRNLVDFSVDVNTTFRVASYVPKNIIVVSESGIATNKDIKNMLEHDIHSVLVGETLMRAESPGKALKELIGG